MSEKPSNGWKSPRDSAHKLIIWFSDGAKRTFYSLDWKNTQSEHRNNDLGLARLKNLVAKYGNKVGTAIIYHLETDLMVAKYVKGVAVNFNNKPIETV